MEGGEVESVTVWPRGAWVEVGKGAVLPKKDVLLTGERGGGRMLGKEKRRNARVYTCL